MVKITHFLSQEFSKFVGNSIFVSSVMFQCFSS